MTDKQPETLRLADALEREYSGCHADEGDFIEMDAAAELRRLYASEASLREQNTELDRKLAEQEAVMQQALEALEMCLPDAEGSLLAWTAHAKAVVALRERLAQPYCDDCGGTDPECPLAQPEQDEMLQVAEALRRVGLTLVRTDKGFDVMNLGQIEAHGAAQPEPQHTNKYVTQEPVAWMWKDGTVTADPDRADGTWTPLYTTPPRREWVGLTEEEIKALPQWYPSHEAAAVMPLIRAIEAKLREKNT